MLSKSITIIESTKTEDRIVAQEILEACLPITNTSRRVGISGAPGAGKSTFIDAFGSMLLNSNKSIAVLAVDPSSTISKGSILGDKTRMEQIVNHPNCFIRPSASNNTLGGVARHTREAIVLCEAFGFDYIFVETVGVGQSETMVKKMVDVFLLLLLPNSGDELQGIKRGIMEMADIVLINKADGMNSSLAKTAAAQVKMALHLFAANENNWTIPVLTLSSLEKTGLEEVKSRVDSYFLQMESSGYFTKNRTTQQIHWFEEEIVQSILSHLEENSKTKKLRDELIKQIESNQIDPVSAAEKITKSILK